MFPIFKPMESHIFLIFVDFSSLLRSLVDREGKEEVLASSLSFILLRSRANAYLYGGVKYTTTKILKLR